MADKIEYRCAACGHEGKAAAAAAGKFGACPKCKSPVQVPEKLDVFGPVPAEVAPTIEAVNSDVMSKLPPVSTEPKNQLSELLFGIVGISLIIGSVLALTVGAVRMDILHENQRIAAQSRSAMAETIVIEDQRSALTRATIRNAAWFANGCLLLGLRYLSQIKSKT